MIAPAQFVDHFDRRLIKMTVSASVVNIGSGVKAHSRAFAPTAKGGTAIAIAVHMRNLQDAALDAASVNDSQQ